MTAALIERLEKAEAGSRELDALIWCEFNDAVCYRLTDQERALIYTPRTGKGMRRESNYAPVTTSLDAALALAERAGLRPYLADATIKGRWRWTLVNPALLGDLESEPWTNGVAATPALALCIAILKAKAAQS